MKPGELGEATMNNLHVFAICPVCEKRIRLHARKDFESFTGEEAAEHIKTEHPEAITGDGDVPLCEYVTADDEAEPTWDHIRRPFNTRYASGHQEKYTAQIGEATISIFHRAATVEASNAYPEWVSDWDVGIKINGQGYDRIFAGQPVHSTPAAARAWVKNNAAKIRDAIALIVAANGTD